MESDGIAVAKVDATIEVSLASRMGISGYPTLLLYANADGSTKMYKYQGARSTERLAEFARGGYSEAQSTWYPSRMLYSPINALINLLMSMEKAMNECMALGAGSCVAIVCGCLVGLLIVFFVIAVLYSCIFESSQNETESISKKASRSSKQSGERKED